MSLEKAIKTLMLLGLTETDSIVYVYLAKKGPNQEENLANDLKLNKNQIFFSLKNLVTKGMVSKTPEQSIRYSAIPLEQVLNQLANVAEEQIKILQESRKALLSNWRSMIEKDSKNNS